MVWSRVEPPRFAALCRHDPQMRDFRICLEIAIFAIEHHPFSIRRRHRRADAFELHHVFEGEWMFATGDTGPRCLREKRSCERETKCDKNFHLAVKLPPNLRTCNESARVAHDREGV